MIYSVREWNWDWMDWVFEGSEWREKTWVRSLTMVWASDFIRLAI